MYGYYVWQINLRKIKETDTIAPLVLCIWPDLMFLFNFWANILWQPHMEPEHN